MSKHYRGYGLGKILVQAVHDWVEAEGHRGYIGQDSASGGGVQGAGSKVTIKLEAQVSTSEAVPGIADMLNRR